MGFLLGLFVSVVLDVRGVSLGSLFWLFVRGVSLGFLLGFFVWVVLDFRGVSLGSLFWLFVRGVSLGCLFGLFVDSYECLKLSIDMITMQVVYRHRNKCSRQYNLLDNIM